MQRCLVLVLLVFIVAAGAQTVDEPQSPPCHIDMECWGRASPEEQERMRNEAPFVDVEAMFGGEMFYKAVQNLLGDVVHNCYDTCEQAVPAFCLICKAPPFFRGTLMIFKGIGIIVHSIICAIDYFGAYHCE